MYENDMKSTPEHTSRGPGMAGTATGKSDAAGRGSDHAASRHETATPRTDPKFARESFTLRRMQTWQIVALAVAAAVVVALVIFYT